MGQGHIRHKRVRVCTQHNNVHCVVLDVLLSLRSNGFGILNVVWYPCLSPHRSGYTDGTRLCQQREQDHGTGRNKTALTVALQ